MSDYLNLIGVSVALTLSAGALLYAIWTGRHTSVELARPDPAQMEARARQQEAINGLLVNQQDLLRRVLELELLVTEYQLGTSQLIAQLESMGVTPVWRPKSKTPTNGGVPESESISLYRAIVAQFSMDELTTLMLDAGIPEAEVGGDTATARALELVQYAQRHGQLDALKAACRKARPRGKWGK